MFLEGVEEGCGDGGVACGGGEEGDLGIGGEGEGKEGEETKEEAHGCPL